MMKHLRSSMMIFFFLMLLFALQSCAGVKKQTSSESPAQITTIPERPAQPAPVSDPPVQKKVSTERPAQAPAGIKRTMPAPEPAPPVQMTQLAQKRMDAGEYQDAIDIYNYEHRKQPRDQNLMQAYAKSLDGLKIKADAAYAKNDFDVAGKLYLVLHKNYAKFNSVAKMLSFNKAYLNARLAACKKALSVQGFQEYRNGRLSNALALWQGVLDIDPNNKDIKEAMRTAKQQQKNLAQEK